MLDQNYELLVNYLEGMISDGVQLVHGGRLIDWSDTKILKLLQDIHSKQAELETESLEPGDLLQNKYTGQKAAVIYEDDESVHLNPLEKVLVYPKDQIWHHFKRSKPGE